MKKLYTKVFAILFFINLVGLLTVEAQTDVDFVKAARKSWDNLNYFQAKDQYNSAIEVNQENFDANLELGLLHVEVYQNYKVGLNYFNKALTYMPTDTVYEVYKFLGESNQIVGQYMEAVKHFTTFKKGIVKNDELKAEIDRKIAQCLFAEEYDYVHWDGKFVNMGEQINSESSEYCSVLPMKDSFMLFTKRMSESIDGKVSVIAWEDIYFTKNKNKQYHEAEYSQLLPDFSNLSTDDDKHFAVVSTSLTGDTLIMYKENGLWYSTYQGDSWSVPLEFSKTINFGRNQRHACFSPDGQELIFSSKAKNGVGGYDLYVSKIDSTGNWGVAKLLDHTINTTMNEDSPFISSDGQYLYFASDGLMGFGGYDIFVCEKTEDGWSTPKNAGRPFNSSTDDIFFNIGLDNKTSMLSSSRAEGYGQMDIYYFYQYGESKFNTCEKAIAKIQLDSTAMLDSNQVEIDPKIVLSGKDTVMISEENVFSKVGTSFSNAVITNTFFKYDTIIQEVDSVLLTFDSVGVYELSMEVLARDTMNEELRYCVIKEITVIEEVKDQPVVRHVKDSNELELAFGSKITDEQLKALPDGFALDLESIYFDFSKSYVRSDQRTTLDKNIELIKANPNIVIKVIGHTDKVGSKEYNLKLSTKRAKAAVDYLVSKGVSINQIVAVLSQGEDEAGVRYKNEDGSDNIELMEESRRVDFFVIGKTE